MSDSKHFSDFENDIPCLWQKCNLNLRNDACIQTGKRNCYASGIVFHTSQKKIFMQLLNIWALWTQSKHIYYLYKKSFQHFSNLNYIHFCFNQETEN